MREREKEKELFYLIRQTIGPILFLLMIRFSLSGVVMTETTAKLSFDTLSSWNRIRALGFERRIKQEND